MALYEKIEPKPLPRWVTMPLGLIFTPFTFICVVGSVTLLIAPNVPPTVITVSLSSIFLAGSLWVFYLSLRLLFVSPKSRSKFISPMGLKVVPMVFAVIPIVSIIIGTFWEKPLVHSIMTIAYIGIVFRLSGMSNYRGQNA
ncbi:hypothetical protein [Teredinibacter turnerae]|uniref:hypothetical protein n=1 Tax=Teredinibacter turnerae TaxID=2426 RepID=UPI0030CCB9EC